MKKMRLETEAESGEILGLEQRRSGDWCGIAEET